MADKARVALGVAAGQLRGTTDWLFFDHIGPAAIQALIPRPYRRPYGVFLYSIEVWGHLDRLSLLALRKADVRIAISQFTIEKTLAAHPDVGSIGVCPLALPQGGSNGGIVDRELIGKIQARSVSIVGRLAPAERHKGHDRLIACWRSVVERIPEAQLVVVGTGEDLPHFREESRKAGCQDSVLFTGWVNEATLHAIYESVAVYAMPSDGEGFGLVFLEAMKHRLPCIASTTDASREVVVDGETGFLVNPADRARLTERLIRLLNDASLRERMGEAGYARLLDCYSFEHFRTNFTRAISPLIKAAGNQPSV
jgi:phosphatidylinositol alpha-1,6-mannosyltransferase